MNDKRNEQACAELLDAALAQYRRVEPRAGLEERLLAHLQTEQQTARWFWWQWGPVLGSAAIIVMLFVALSFARRSISLAPEAASGARMVLPPAQAPANAASISTALIARQSKAVASGTTMQHVTRKLRMVHEPAAPQLLAQQFSLPARPSRGSELHIEEVKIAAVAVADIVIK